MGRRLCAVLVSHTATVNSIQLHLIGPMLPLVRDQQIRGFRYGGCFTGAWDRSHDPTLDARNRRACTDCPDLGSEHCVSCATSSEPGTTVSADPHTWAPYPGDIVPLTQLLHPGWRYPKGTTPHAWVDLAGIVPIGASATADNEDGGEPAPPPLLQVFDDLQAGRRDPHPTIPDWPVTGFNPAQWSVAVVDADC